MRLLFNTFSLGLLAFVGYCALASAKSPTYESPQFRDGRFSNAARLHEYTVGEQVRVWWTFMFDKPDGTVPGQAIPIKTLSKAALLAAPDNTMYRLGHSTVLIKIAGEFYLTDPMFSNRPSPVQWAGPLRFHAPPISLADLPPIKAVMLSHDHYDHLDHATIMALAARTSYFLTPLGVGDRLIEWGVDPAKVRQLDWWQEKEIDGVRFVATPSQHFSGRSLTDRNSTLWASWVIVHDDMRLFFSGDTAYFDGFKAIGEKYGPFDVALMETGAYDKQWPDVHMRPEQTLQAFRDLKGAWLLPIHNGTFDMALHRWQEPLERIAALAKAGGVALATPAIGEPLSLKQPHVGRAWWRDIQ